jgi:hypothetical protein
MLVSVSNGDGLGVYDLPYLCYYSADAGCMMMRAFVPAQESYSGRGDATAAAGGSVHAEDVAGIEIALLRGLSTRADADSSSAVPCAVCSAPPDGGPDASAEGLMLKQRRKRPGWRLRRGKDGDLTLLEGPSRKVAALPAPMLPFAARQPPSDCREVLAAIPATDAMSLAVMCRSFQYRVPVPTSAPQPSVAPTSWRQVAAAFDHVPYQRARTLLGVHGIDYHHDGPDTEVVRFPRA